MANNNVFKGLKKQLNEEIKSFNFAHAALKKALQSIKPDDLASALEVNVAEIKAVKNYILKARIEEIKQGAPVLTADGKFGMYTRTGASAENFDKVATSPKTGEQIYTIIVEKQSFTPLYIFNCLIRAYKAQQAALKEALKEAQTTTNGK